MITHTYVVLELPPSAFEEIRAKLAAVGYQHTFHHDEGYPIVIDMHGIAVAPSPARWVCTWCGAAVPEPGPDDLVVCKKCGTCGCKPAEPVESGNGYTAPASGYVSPPTT
jgi:hypothetical protein